MNVYFYLSLSFQVIINRGAFDHSVYVIQVGETEIVTDTCPPLVTILKKGEVFGDVSYTWMTFGISLCEMMLTHAVNVTSHFLVQSTTTVLMS